MAPTLYMILPSPPVRSVLLCAKAIGLELDEKHVNLLEGEHTSPEYLKLNPQHTVPVLDDDGFIVVDSHAIITYLVSKYGKDDSLYPKDLKKKATVDHRLHFDSGTLFARGVRISRSLILEGEKTVDPKHLAALEEAYGMLEKFLEKNKFVAGDQLTVADFSIVPTITSWNLMLPVSEAKYPKTTAWIKKMEALPYYKEANQVGLEQFGAIIKEKWPK